MAEDKKRVLYLAREMFHNPEISYNLGDNYDVVSFLGENLEDLPDLLDNPPDLKRIDALITGVPPAPVSQTRYRSLEIIANVKKENPKLPIIVYTSAVAGDVLYFATQRSIDKVVPNLGPANYTYDAKKVKDALDALFGGNV